MQPVDSLELRDTAYRVAELEKSIRYWVDSLGARMEMAPTVISADSVRVCFLKFKGGREELVAPINDSKPATERASGWSPNHICFLCPDFDQRMASAPMRVVSSSGPQFPRRRSAGWGCASCCIARSD